MSESKSRADQRYSCRCRSLPPSLVLLRPCSLEARFEVASKEAGLGLEGRNVQLLALVYVSDEASRVYGGPVGAVVPRSGQRYDMARGAMEVHTILPSGTLPAGGEGDACSAFLSSLF